MNANLPPQASVTNASLTTQAESVSTDGSTLSSDKASDLLKEAALRYRIEQIIQQNEAQNITTSVNIADLRSGQTVFDHNADAIHYAASINKLPIALLLLQDLRSGQVHLNDTLTW